jgi:hypothetical protein
MEVDAVDAEALPAVVEALRAEGQKQVPHAAAAIQEGAVAAVLAEKAPRAEAPPPAEAVVPEERAAAAAEIRVVQAADLRECQNQKSDVSLLWAGGHHTAEVEGATAHEAEVHHASLFLRLLNQQAVNCLLIFFAALLCNYVESFPPANYRPTGLLFLNLHWHINCL